MKKSFRVNPKATNARPLYTGRTRKLPGKDAAHMIGISVFEIRYRHAADGKDYKHPFETDDVILLGMPDGSLKIESASGNRLWQHFDV